MSTAASRSEAVLPARSEHRQTFWSVVVGAPAALSVLRLWVESGGELQTTLLRRMHAQVPVALIGCGAALAGYAWLVGPAVSSAWNHGEQVVAVLLALPPLVAFGVAGPLPRWFAQIFAVVAQVAVLALAVVAMVAALRTPILPLVVVSYETPAGSEFVRGNIVTVDDAYLTLLQEHGGVRYLPISEVRSTVLCGTTEELPAYATRIRDYHVEDSLLSAFGRHVRPHAQIDPFCRIASV